MILLTEEGISQHSFTKTSLGRDLVEYNEPVKRDSQQDRIMQGAGGGSGVDEYRDNIIRLTGGICHVFYVGDFHQLELFFRQRVSELTMKLLRPMVAAWIKRLEPKRLKTYGRYHRKLVSEMPSGSTPSWWPQCVRYEEPSHLDRSGK